VPLRAIGGKEADAVAGLDAQFDEGVGEAGYAAEEFLRGDGFPAVGMAEQLGTRRREFVDGVEKAGRKGAVSHRNYRIYMSGMGSAMGGESTRRLTTEERARKAQRKSGRKEGKVDWSTEWRHGPSVAMIPPLLAANGAAVRPGSSGLE
jgi:hypothetical protein